MRKILLTTLLAALSLSGCDNPEEFQHPENRKAINVTVPAPAPNPTDASTATPTNGTDIANRQAPINDPSRDASPSKTADATIAGAFDGLSVAAPLEVDVTVGGDTKVTVDCNEKSFDSIKFEVKDTILNITSKPGFNAAKAKIQIVTPTLTSLETANTSLVKVVGISGPSLNVVTGGLSSVELSGAADNLNLTTTGSSLAKLKGVESKTAAVTSSDSSVAELKCTEAVSANASGQSVINISGLPRKVNKKKESNKSFINITN